jgi:pimeloyl-ACP methyl ester carboxylesterase
MSDQKGITLETRIDKDGREFATTRTATPGGVDEMYISPNQAIPVIFIPGIMGSPLIATGNNRNKWDGQGKWAWFPDDAYEWVVKGYGKLEYDKRRHLLDPTKTRALDSVRDVDMKAFQKFYKDTAMPAEEAVRRGWGSVMITSYGKTLLHLENQLRFIFYRGHPYPGTYSAIPSDPNAWGELKGYAKLSEETLRKAAAWRFPVYAVGYNWMDSNGKSADFLKQRIDAIREDCRKRLNLKCDKVILVTHSMGGLVARMCAKRNPDDILGVVHGEQPAIGAGTAYARVRGGWDANLKIFSPLASIESQVGAWALGKSGFEVSAVFSAGAGPLELLPNQLYGSGWLKIQWGKGRSAETLFTLPEKDPYEEIYKDRQHWWRLIHPDCLVEKKKVTDAILKGKEWDKYAKQLGYAQAFHAELGAYYHPKTYAHCGADSGQPAWRDVAWQLEPLTEISTGLRGGKLSPTAAREAILSNDYMRGTCIIRDPAGTGDVLINRNGVGVIAQSGGSFYRAWLSDKDDSGDATVPAHSGMAPRDHAAFFAKMKGFEHQGSYENEAVQAVTLYSMISLAATAGKLA